MELNNNAVLHPTTPCSKDEVITPKILKPIVERLSTIESELKNYENEFTTKDLYADYAEIETLKYDYVYPGGGLDVDAIKVRNLGTDTPIESSQLVGYDENNKLIPITLPDEIMYYDYVVNSQSKFDDLIALAKAHNVSYKSIAIIGGLGGGTNGEYTLTVDTSTTTLHFDNVKITGYINAKIDITSDNPNSLSLFSKGTFDNVAFYVHGTIASNKTLVLFILSNIENGDITCTILLEISNTTLKNTKLEDCKTLWRCSLVDCDDVSTIVPNYSDCNLENCKVYESYFDDCNSPRVYLRNHYDSSKKYRFTYCSMHLDIFNDDPEIQKTVFLRVSDITESQLTFLNKEDCNSSSKIFNITVDSADAKSTLIGNNDNVYSVYKSIAKQVSKSISPNKRSIAYICIGDKTHTPIFSSNGTNFYADEGMTVPVDTWTEPNNPDVYYSTCSFKLGSLYYDSLEFSKTLSGSASSKTIKVIKLSDYLCDDYYINDSRVKQYYDAGDASKTIMYSNDSGSNMYLTPDVSSSFKIKKYKTQLADYTDLYLYELGSDEVYATSMDFSVLYGVNSPTSQSFNTIEIPSTRDLYNVRISSPYNVPLFVQNAHYTKTKTV